MNVAAGQPRPPLCITMHERDNVAIVVNDGGLSAGAVFASGLALREHVPQGRKVALVDLAEGTAVRRYDVTIGHALRTSRRGKQRQHDAGQQEGGLSNIVEKAMGSIVKSGSAPIAGVLPPGEKLDPAQRSGMNLHVFTTGRGTPYGRPAACPVIKVATRSELARRWHDLMDVNAGRIAGGEATIEQTGWELFRLMLDMAGGRKRTWAEQWKLHNALVLFNPAPVT